jgi:aldehyde dehydrogenase (NAD+)
VLGREPEEPAMSAAAHIVPSSDIDSISPTVQKLRASYEAGRTRSIEWRQQQLKQMIAMLDDHADDFMQALADDFGKPALEALTADVGQAKMEAQSALKKLRKWTRPERVGLPISPMGRSRIIREPLGVVLIISPWNYPIGLLLAPAVGAIAAGNAMVLKPSEVTPHTSAALARWVPEYLDTEAIALVEGGVDETTALLEERFDHIMYTGNGRIAEVVMSAAARHLTPVTLELGGKSPCIVDRGVNLEITAHRIAWGKFMNAGQTCIAPDYILAHEDIESDLVDALQRAVKEFYGDSPRQSPDYARVVNQRHHQRLSALLKDEEVAFGGEIDEDDCYIAPTVLRNVSRDSAVMQDEIFGPILPVLKVKDIDEAISIVNEGEKPLALYVFTKDSATEDRVLERTSSGGACVNGTIVHISDARLPFGGVGPSGMGAYHGRHTFETFSHRKAVMTRGFSFDIKLMYPPYTERMVKLAKRFL